MAKQSETQSGLIIYSYNLDVLKVYIHSTNMLCRLYVFQHHSVTTEIILGRLAYAREQKSPLRLVSHSNANSLIFDIDKTLGCWPVIICTYM